MISRKEEVMRKSRAKVEVALHGLQELEKLEKWAELDKVVAQLAQAMHALDHEINLISELRL